MTRRYYRPLKTKTVIDTLHFVRQEIVREDWDGLEHVDHLLRMYGADPDALATPKKKTSGFARRELTQIVLGALRDGPHTGASVVALVVAHKEGLAYQDAYKRVYTCFTHLKGKGLVVRDGRLWRLA